MDFWTNFMHVRIDIHGIEIITEVSKLCQDRDRKDKIRALKKYQNINYTIIQVVLFILDAC